MMNKLKPGDTVSLIAPARSVTVEEMQPFIQWLKSRGLIVKPGKHLFSRHHQFSAADIDRAEDFVQAWMNPEVRAVFCARGGYGCMRMLQYIDDDILKSGSGKILAGFSDITTLHLALNKLDIPTVHSPMAINFFEPKKGFEENSKRFAKLLFEGECTIDLSDCEILRNQRFEGEIIGGNLSLIFASLGTPEQPETKDKILFIEDLDEYLYHIDRMMVSLKRADLFDGIKALLVGEMNKMNDNIVAFGQDANEIVAEHVAEYDFPVIFNFPAGHGIKNYSFALGSFTTFDGSLLKQS